MSKSVEAIIEKLKDSITYQENPDNRIVTSIRVDDSNPVYDAIYFTSNCDGFAEEEKLAFKTYNKGKYSTEYLNSYEYLAHNYGVGSSESELLSDLKTSEILELKYILDRYFNDPSREELEDAAEFECCASLITSNGDCNWLNILALRRMGYDVYAGDQDSFGWLTGVVEKDGIQLIYG